MDVSTRRLVPLARAESLRLLAGVSVGRLVFSRQALPAIGPVAHLLDGAAIVVRSQCPPEIVSAAPGRTETVVAFEADVIDDATHIGWSVTVVGVARLVLDPDEQARYCARLRQWIDAPGDQLISILPELVTGFRLVEGAAVDVVST